jgi:hypothetical protein
MLQERKCVICSCERSFLETIQKGELCCDTEATVRSTRFQKQERIVRAELLFGPCFRCVPSVKLLDHLISQ